MRRRGIVASVCRRITRCPSRWRMMAEGCLRTSGRVLGSPQCGSEQRRSAVPAASPTPPAAERWCALGFPCSPFHSQLAPAPDRGTERDTCTMTTGQRDRDAGRDLPVPWDDCISSSLVVTSPPRGSLTVQVAGRSADMNREPVRVLIADDHPALREGLQVLLGSAPVIDIVGQASTGWDAIRLAEELQPDVIIMDLHMP